jgi:predicted phage-related endonuclease
MVDLGHSPEAEVSRAMERVLTVEKAVGEAIKSTEISAQAQRRAATEQAQRIIERVEQRLSAVHRELNIQLREEVARLQAESRLTLDNYPDLQPSPQELEQLASEAARWLTTDGDH